MPYPVYVSDPPQDDENLHLHTSKYLCKSDTWTPHSNQSINTAGLQSELCVTPFPYKCAYEYGGAAVTLL